MIIYPHATNAQQVMKSLAESQEQLDVWFTEQILELTGTNCNEPMGDLPEQIAAWER